VFSDELNHASIIDGCRLSRADVVVYPHADVHALERLLGQHHGARRVVITESLFSMDGDVADVAALADIARSGGASLILDEAHAIGVLGPEGRGIAAAVGVTPDLLIGTAGKALGGFGAFAATSSAVASLLWSKARSFVFSTGLPPAVSAATRAAIEIVRGTSGDALRRSLQENIRVLRGTVPGLGGSDESPIAPLHVGDDRRVMEMTAELLADGIFVQGIRPPTVPVGTARLRISVTARHAVEQVTRTATRLTRFT
jgi:7-keto-8-aminopelargonate synthetase-like enzyme